MKKYRVVIPYYYEFYVEASNHKNAINKCHEECNGIIISYDDDGAVVEELED